jgi:hypothetical protein
VRQSKHGSLSKYQEPVPSVVRLLSQVVDTPEEKGEDAHIQHGYVMINQGSWDLGRRQTRSFL